MTKPAIACVLLSIPTNSPDLFTTPNALQCCFFGLTSVTQPAYQSKVCQWRHTAHERNGLPLSRLWGRCVYRQFQFRNHRTDHRPV
jgi:hypothetical protein